MTVTEHRYLQEDELIHRAVEALLRTLGPVETTRFLDLARSRPLDSVQRHRVWQESLDKDTSSSKYSDNRVLSLVNAVFA
jgi:hypothetical protein